MSKTYWVLFFLLFPLTGCYPQGQTTTDFSDPYSWDFGAVKRDEVLKHDFVLKNESGRILTIKGTNTSCGCTISKIEKSTLLPGETTIIKVQFNTKGYKGEVQQFVYVNTDDTENPVLRFIIKANVTE